MKRLSKFFIILFVVLITFVLGLSVVGLILEDKIIALSIDKINRELKVKVKINDVKLSMLSGFPKVTVSMKGVEIIEGGLNTPSEFEPGLLSLEEIDVRFGLWGIINNEYNFDEIILKNGWLNLYFDNSGKGNFEIFEGNTKSDGNWLLSLDAFKLDNINLSYIDLRTGWIFKGFIEKANLKGELAQDQIILNIYAKGVVGTLRQREFFYIRNQRFDIYTDFFVTPKEVKITSSQATVGATKFVFSGSYGRERGDLVSVNVSGSDLGIETLTSFLSQYNFLLPKNTQSKGKINFNFDLKGFTRTETPYKIDLNFNTDLFEIIIPNKPQIYITKLNGSFTNGLLGTPESSEIKISNIEIKSGNSLINGALRIKNINKPLYQLKIQQVIRVDDLLSWGLDVPLISGQVSGQVEAIGVIDNINSISVKSFEDSKFYSNLEVKDLAFKQVGRIPELKNISGIVSVNNQDITSAKLKGIMHGSNFEADVQSKHALSIVFGNRKAIVNANITLDSLNTHWLFNHNSEELIDKSSFSAWDRIESISGDVFIDKFIHKNFVSSPLSANIYFKKDQLFCNSFLSRACNGIFTGRFSSHNLGNDKYILAADIDMEGVDISQLFESFNNFDQQTIESENISGKLEGSILFTTPITAGIVSKEDFEANAILKVIDGRLTNVKQLESLSNFIDLNELKDIKFSTLENTVRVSGEQVIIPQMDIQSSAIDLSLSGKHSFNGEYLYQFQLLLSDILYSKMLSKNQDNNSFGQIEDDGSGKTKLYLKLEGDLHQSKVSYDGPSARIAFRESLKQERQTLKNILLDEFKFLRRDKISTDSIELNNELTDSLNIKGIDTKSKAKTKQNPKYTIEWDDE